MTVVSKQYQHRDQLVNQEFDNLYRHASRSSELGPFKWMYDESTGKLFLLHWDQGTKQYTSVLRIDKDGNVDAAGTVTGSVTLEQPGRG
jgi:hypothetical protein